MRRRRIFSPVNHWCVLVASIACLASIECARVPGRSMIRPEIGGRVYEIRGGRWFDGRAFAERTVWLAGGVVRERRPSRIDSVIDAHGRFVIPAFAEGHMHNIGCPASAAEAAPYERDGVMYAWRMSGTYPPRGVASSPTLVDVACASPPLTANGSHIVLLDQRSARQGNLPGLGPNDLDGRTYVVIDSAADIPRKLPRVLDARPAVVKIILAFSEEFRRRRADSTFVGKRGIDPDLVGEIVRQSHARGLRVAAHVETAADFRVALAAGVDVIAHLPGLRIGDAGGFPGDTSTARYRISHEDAERATRQGTIVLTTVMASRAFRTPTDPGQPATRAIFAANARTLLAAGARLVVGSDLYGGTVVDEAFALANLGITDNATLLRMWTMDTPRAIFPDRRVGCVREGCEANLLLLDGDPIADFRNVRRISLRVKAGAIVRPE